MSVNEKINMETKTNEYNLGNNIQKFQEINT